MKNCQHNYGAAMPLWICGGSGALGVAISSHFVMAGLLTSAGLIAITAGLHFWNQKRQQTALETMTQKFRQKLQQENEQKIQDLQREHEALLSKTCMQQVQQEQARIQNRLARLVEQFEILDHENVNPSLTIEECVENLTQRVKNFSAAFSQPTPSSNAQDFHVVGLESLCQQVLPIWANQIEMARSHTEEAISNLAQRFDALSQRLDAAVRT